MNFRPWRPKVPEVLRKTPPRSQLDRARDILRGWHLSVPSKLDMDRLFHLLESSVPVEGVPADGTITQFQHSALHNLMQDAETFRGSLLLAMAALSR